MIGLGLMMSIVVLGSAASHATEGRGVRAAMRQALQSHARGLVHAANRQFERRDALQLTNVQLDNVRVGRRTVRFRARMSIAAPGWEGGSMVLQGTVKRRDLDAFIAGGAAPSVRVRGARSVERILKDAGVKGPSEATWAMLKLKNPEEIQRFVRHQIAQHPLARPKMVSEFQSGFIADGSIAAWVLALRAAPERTSARWGSGRPADQLVREVKASAAKRGTRDWVFHAVSTVEHPGEIGKVVRRAMVEHPEVVPQNLRLMVRDMGANVPGTDRYWLGALEVAERGQRR